VSVAVGYSVAIGEEEEIDPLSSQVEG